MRFSSLTRRLMKRKSVATPKPFFSAPPDFMLRMQGVVLGSLDSRVFFRYLFRILYVYFGSLTLRVQNVLSLMEFTSVVIGKS